MAPLTIKRAVVNALEDLTSDDFLKFCHQLRDRREEPRITRRAVEGKSVLEVADLLVSKFTEIKALQVTLDTLRQIDCNEEAETLYSNNKACLDKGDPSLPKTLNGKVETKASQEAQKYAADQRPLQAAQLRGPPVMIKPKEEEAEAKDRVLSEGRDQGNDKLALSRLRIQFGKYKGQTFKWLLENDVGYTAYVVATHRMEREQTKRKDSMMSNKDSLTQYATAYPEVLKEVEFQLVYRRSLQSGQAGKVLVGFGKYQMETLQNLYESKDSEKISYVNYLRGMKSTCEPGSKMEDAIKYILKRDEQAAAHRQRLAKMERVQSTRGQPKTNEKAKSKGGQSLYRVKAP